MDTTIERLEVLGADKDHPTAVVDVVAPVSGVITDQQVTAASGTQGLASPNAFTISDLSRVWILCDVYENDLALVTLGEDAEIRLNAYPNMILKGRISNIGAILDPTIRTAKVRVEVENPGMMRLGMFVTGEVPRPASPRLMAQFRPPPSCTFTTGIGFTFRKGANTFRRVEVQSGQMIPPASRRSYPASARRPRGRGRAALENTPDR